jgi:group I intron endonuclease
VLRTSGIYKISCRPSGKVYVGSAVNMYRRWHSRHLPQLRRNKHSNRHLQSAWNKYGESAFTCEVIEQCDTTELISREQYWMDKFDSVGLCGFNIAKLAGSTIGVPQSEKCKQAILQAKCKCYVVRDPAGRESTITNLKRFCGTHGLTSTVMNKVAVGKAKHHRRWECRPATMSRRAWLSTVTARPVRPLKVKNGRVWCSKCQNYKAADDFNRDKQKPSGFAAYCRGCNCARLTSQYQKRRAA